MGDEHFAKQIETESSITITFNPPVYVQRYSAVRDLLENERSLNSVLDYGCAEFKLFKHLKNIQHIEYIAGVDVDVELVKRCKYEANPLPCHYVLGFPHKLRVDLFAGSIAEPDRRLLNIDAVICIEIIEHLYSEELEKVPSTIFKHIKPKLVVFTTPNADFNVLFNLKGFRHDDHKFEWTREEFQKWCSKIVNEYPEYHVECKGIGEGPPGTEALGCCSQMAVFRRNHDQKLDHIEVDEPYQLIDSYEYPYQPDNRTDEEKFTDELTYQFNRIFISKYFMNSEDDLKFEIPCRYLWELMKEFYPEMDIFIDVLKEKGYTILKSDEYILEIFQNEGSTSDSDDLSINNLNLDLTTFTEIAETECWDNELAE